MFRNMKLSRKLSLGFGLLVLISLALGTLAIVNMSRVSSLAQHLAQDNVPAVAVANNVERMALSTMYEARGYGYTEEQGFLEKTRQNFALTQKYLEEAKQHADARNMQVLGRNAELAAVAAAHYGTLFAQTVERTQELGLIVATADSAASKFVQAVSEYLDAQEKALSAYLDHHLGSMGQQSTGTDGLSLDEGDRKTIQNEIGIRFLRMKAANDILDQGNEVVVHTWRSIANRDPEHFRATMGRFQVINRMLDDLQRETRQESNLRLIAACRAGANEYLQNMERFLNAWLARETLGAERGQAAQKVLDAANQTASYNITQTEQSAADAAALLEASSNVMMMGLVLAVIIGIGAAFFISRSITKPINRVIAGLSTGAGEVASASNEVSSASQSLAEGASEQAAAIEETSSSLEEMSSMTKQNAENATQARSKMGEAREIVSRVNAHMNDMAEAIEEITKTSEETGKIIKTIDEIAFQTNLLALNAAVEAARAGEAGAGFAVVADEVRNLAMRAAEAAKNTADLIEKTIKSVRNGNELTQSTRQAYQASVEISAKVGELVDEIAAASEEQAQGIDQINRAVTEMDKVTQQNAASAEESASASEELNAQADEMQAMVQELVVMVGQVSDGKESKGGPDRMDQIPRRVPGKPFRTATLTTAQKTMAKRGREVRPQQLIPLNDRELKEF